MDHDRARSILADKHRAVLATYRADGGVQLSPVTVALDDEGRPIISTRQTAYKVKNLRNDPRASLCVFSDAFFGEWVQVDGTATIVDLPEAMEPLVDYYRRASGGEHPDWDEYRAAMERDKRVLVRLEITHAGPDRHG
jgi:PPOX class probable F420-dependent enzyme